MIRESGYYPPGAEHDPNAPWNQPDPIECKECGGTGTLTVKNEDGEHEQVACSLCLGDGVIDPEPDYPEEYNTSNDEEWK